MEKMALFVEGQTEQIFVERLIYEIAGRHNVHIDAVQAFGGAICPRHFVRVHASCPNPKKQYYVLIYDCMGDSRLLSDIRDHYATLTNQGYREIVGLRDVHPLTHADIPTIRSDFAAFLPATPVKPLLVLAIMEIEAWFIAEDSHFGRLHPSLVPTAVKAQLGYDPTTHDVQLVAVPSNELRSAYSVAGLGYTKSKKHVERTVKVLDYASVYLSLPARLPDLQALVTCIDRFLA
jgi:hypothetical protein